MLTKLTKSDYLRAIRAYRAASYQYQRVGAAADVLRAAGHGVPSMPHASPPGDRALVACSCGQCQEAWAEAHRINRCFSE